MSDPYLGEIKIVSFNFAPRGWAFCNGQLLPITQNQALFSILGTFYGGNGSTTFALPNLGGRMPIHAGQTSVGSAGGEAAHVLTLSELPAHTHPVAARATPDASTPAGNFFAGSATPMFATAPDAAMSPAALAPVGGGQPHENRGPFLALTFVIALVGIYPSRN